MEDFQKGGYGNQTITENKPPWFFFASVAEICFPYVPPPKVLLCGGGQYPAPWKHPCGPAFPLLPIYGPQLASVSILPSQASQGSRSLGWHLSADCDHTASINEGWVYISPICVFLIRCRLQHGTTKM